MPKPFLKRFSLANASGIKVQENAVDARNRYQKKVASKEYVFEDKPCVCSSKDDLLVSEIDRNGLYYPMVICKKCGLMRANPRLDEKSIAGFYDNEYRELYGEKDADREKKWEEKVNQGQMTFKRIMSMISLKPGAVVVEIGCNMGATLSVFKENGFKVFGFDYGSKNIEYGSSKLGQGSLFTGGLDKALSMGIKADLVLFVHVYEHLSDLKRENEKIKALLKDNGYLYIDVPGTYWWTKNICKGNISDLLQNAHNYQFTLETLKYVMGLSGFDLITGDQKINAVFQKKISCHASYPPGETNKVLNFLRSINNIYLFKRFLIRIVKGVLRK